jgi:hypothetical protein
MLQGQKTRVSKTPTAAPHHPELSVNNLLEAAMATKATRAEFLDVYPSLVEDLLGECRKYNLPDNALTWFEKVGALSTHPSEVY